MNYALTLPKVGDSHGEQVKLVSFTLDQEEFCVDVLKVREIIHVPVVTRVPNTPPYLEGVINLRGKVIPVISMRKKFGLQEVERDKQTRIMVMEASGELIGFIVDAVSEVIRVSASEIQPSPAKLSGDFDQECIAGVINQADRLLVLLNLEMMLGHDDKKLLIGI